MSKKLQHTAWPYVVVVVCLFLLTALAPQLWRTHERESDFVAPPPPAVQPANTELLTDVVLNVVEENVAVDPLPGSLDLMSAESEALVVKVQPMVASRFAPAEQPRSPGELAEPQEIPLGEAALSALTTADGARRIARASGRPTAERQVVYIRRRRRRTQTAPTPAGYAQPLALQEQLKALQQHQPTKDWATKALAEVGLLEKTEELGSAEVQPAFAEMSKLVDQSKSLADQIKVRRIRSDLLRAGYALHRHVVIWRQLNELSQKPPAPSRPRVSPLATLPRVEQFLRSARAEAWSPYLGLAKTRKLVTGQDNAGLRRHARVILSRMDVAKLSEEQHTFVDRPEIKSYLAALRPWAAGLLDSRQLLEVIQEYELEPCQEAAADLSEIYHGLRWSEDPGAVHLAELLNTHYRNANVRIALSRAFMKRFLPHPEEIYAPVNDYVVGARVTGLSQTSAELDIVLMPDPNTWRMNLEVQGLVASETSSTRGPVTTYQDGVAEYRVDKLLQVDSKSIRANPSEATATSSTDLVGLQTDFDALPLLNLLARSIAMQQYDSVRYTAEYETEERVSSEARQRFDTEINQRLQTAQSRLTNTVVKPLANLKVKPSVSDMRTTSNRLIGRFRLAGDLHLAAHTPRPQAPSDSLLSVQIHESAMNNSILGMDLVGREHELESLYRELSERFGDGKEVVIPEDLPEDVTLRFADPPLRVKCTNGRVRVSIGIDELARGKRVWRNFGVTAYYRPDSQQLDANLVRDGAIELSGKLGFRDRLPLRLIFGKVLSRSQKFNLVNKKLATDPRLRDMRVNQFVVVDGWVGVALGPQRTAVSPYLNLRR